MALLLLIYCLMYFPLFVGVLCLSLFCYTCTFLCVHFSFAIILKRKRKLVALLLLSCRIMYCYYKCSVALYHCAMGWSAVCDCGIYQFKHISLPNLIQQWGWVTCSHNLSYDPSPTIYTYIRVNTHGLTSTNTYEY